MARKKKKQEFQQFEKKIPKLKALKRELNDLDTKGFETDVAHIKAQLKDISKTKQIEEELAILRKKIKKRKNSKQLEKLKKRDLKIQNNVLIRTRRIEEWIRNFKTYVDQKFSILEKNQKEVNKELKT